MLLEFTEKTGAVKAFLNLCLRPQVFANSLPCLDITPHVSKQLDVPNHQNTGANISYYQE